MTDNIALDELSDNLGLLYEASLHPERWPYVLEALCEEFGANKAQLLYIHPEEFTFSFASGFGFDPYDYNIGASRFRRYLSLDPVALYALDHVNEAFSDRRVIDPDELHQSPMQIDIRNPADMEYLLTIYITEENTDGTVLIFFKGKDQSAFDEQDEARLTRYASHIKRATQIHKALAGSQQLENLQTAFLNRLQWGVVVIDGDRRVLLCNRVGERILSECDGVAIRNHRLVCHRRSEQEQLSQSISNALDGAYEIDSEQQLAIKINNLKGGHPIFLVTTPFNIEKFEEKKENLPIKASHYTTKIPNRRYALITFCNPNHDHNWCKMLEDLFGLTPAESALVDKLADDCTLKEAADALQRSSGTARQQLQTVFEKTGTNRQSSLIRLLMSIPS